MQRLWGEPHRIGQWRRVWLALAESEQELGINIPDAAIAAMRAHLDDADLDAAAAFEKRFRHDVMAHVHAFGQQAPDARPHLHLGATSAFVTDNADVIVMRDSMTLILARLLAVLDALRSFAQRYAALPCLAYTHFQPAQLTTVGKRATLWMQDFALDVEALVHRIEIGFVARAARGPQEHRLRSWNSSRATTTRCASSSVALPPSLVAPLRALQVIGTESTRVQADAQVLDVPSRHRAVGIEPSAWTFEAAAARGRIA